MAVENSCPSKEVLERFVLGQLSPAEVEQWARHVEACARCAATLQGLPAQDTMIEALHDAGDAEANRRQQAVQDLIGRLGRQGPMSDGPTNLANPGRSASPASETTQELCHILAPAQAPDEIGRLGHYRILKILGSGGMGVVFLAQDAQLERLVAIKAMKPALAANHSARKRFLREARLTAALDNDHIVAIHQVGEDRGVPYLAMPLLKGESLDDRLERETKLPIAEVLRIGREIAQGLSAAHEHGLIHRDIKPANIWLEARGRGSGIRDQGSASRSQETGLIAKDYRVKILDFGLARAVEGKGDLTQSGQLLGTPAYMAPEQARGGTVDFRSDLFSLGSVLYRMCTGERPFKGTDVMSTLLSLAQDTPLPPIRLYPEVPAELSELVMLLLSKDPAARPASAHAVVEALAALERSADATCVVARSPDRLVTQSPTDVVAKSPDRASDPDRLVVARSGDRATDPDRRSPSPPQQKRDPQPPLTRSGDGARTRRILAALALLALLGGGFAAYQLLFKTQDGTLIVEVDGDADVRFQKGELRIFDSDGKLKYTLKPSEKNKTLPPGKYLIEVAGIDGLKLDTEKFEIARGDKATVRVTVDSPVGDAKQGDPDRRAADYVLSIGGRIKIRVNGQESAIDDALPKGNFALTTVDLLENQNVTDTGLAQFQGCKNLFVLHLGHTAVTDAGLAHFKHCKSLTFLDLGGTAVTDVGLAHFQDSKKLKQLGLGGTRVTDVGLGYFRDCKDLTHLDFGGTSRVTDAGLAHLKACTNLTYLGARCGQLTDAGLAHLKECTSLMLLDLRNAQVTAEGVTKLSAALPGCKIVWDGGTIEPSMSPELERKAAEWVLSVGGKVTVLVRDQEKEIAAVKDLPSEPWPVASVYLRGNKRIADADLSRLTGLPRLYDLDLGETSVTVTDVGITHLQAMSALTSLSLDKTQVGDADLARLARLSKLTLLGLWDTKISDVGLKHLQKLSELTHLYLSKTNITNAGLAELKPLTKLSILHLNDSSVDDAGLKHLYELRTLTDLRMVRTKVTADAVAALHKALPGCKIYWNGGTIEPKASADCDRKAAEWVLSIGGKLRIEGRDGWIEKTADLPRGAFHVVQIVFIGQQVSAAGLKHLSGLSRIESLELTNCGPEVNQATDVIGELSSLKLLWIHNCGITDEGVKPLRKLSSSLEWLELNQNPLTDAVLDDLELFTRVKDFAIGGGPARITWARVARLRIMKNLTGFYCHFTGLSDDDLAHFKGQKFRNLSLAGDPITDRGLASVATMTYLRSMDLTNCTGITDAGLKHLASLASLTDLNLGACPITDAGLEHLKGLRKLTWLRLSATKVTAAGVAALHKALPGCRITWDGGIIEPSTQPELGRKADE